MLPRMRPALAAVGLIAAIACWASDARAHAALVGSEPPDGAVLAEAPRELTLRFNEPVSPLAMRLVAPDGNAAELAVSSASDARITLALRQPLARGSHLVSWRVISADGHPVGGSVAFAIGAPGAPAARPATGPDLA